MSKSPFWVNEVYSLGYWLKDFGYYPKTWPLFSYMDHGTSFVDYVQPHESANNAPLMFKFSPRLIREFRKVSNKRVYCVLNPTIHCRRINKITKSPVANGTLFFPAHSTELIDDTTNWDFFISNLENIPEEFKPINICLHPSDIKKGLDKIFDARGYKTFTAGNVHDTKFAENMYTIMKNYKYSMSNLLGSYVFYSVEMGIPFSLFGSEPQYVNKGDNNVENGAYTSYKKQPTYQKAVDLFSGFHTEINKKQLEFVNFELGITHSVSRSKTSFLLYKAFFQYLLRHPRYFKAENN